MKRLLHTSVQYQFYSGLVGGHFHYKILLHNKEGI